MMKKWLESTISISLFTLSGILWIIAIYLLLQE
jgi:hypothetical protein